MKKMLKLYSSIWESLSSKNTWQECLGDPSCSARVDSQAMECLCLGMFFVGCLAFNYHGIHHERRKFKSNFYKEAGTEANQGRGGPAASRVGHLKAA
eukprot:CAMPEP_0184295222 /NCGR_PEP_ID=MMETSP1049-20130417/6146_1 /TAXON_ID=77928 /ORGANISM="Proteomonas sulcata, Strain CCMP704" /LENGTH=96 /DNA_ID=CAMNT_0026603681 /DNA_START=103 /DNA_END=393 /DNA_ORIENTATION=-